MNEMTFWIMVLIAFLTGDMAELVDFLRSLIGG